MQGQFDRRVLETRIPKPEQKKPRHVQISLATRPKDQDTIASAETTVNPDANSHKPDTAIA